MPVFPVPDVLEDVAADLPGPLPSGTRRLLAREAERFMEDLTASFIKGVDPAEETLHGKDPDDPSVRARREASIGKTAGRILLSLERVADPSSYIPRGSARSSPMSTAYERMMMTYAPERTDGKGPPPAPDLVHIMCVQELVGTLEAPHDSEAGEEGERAVEGEARRASMET